MRVALLDFNNGYPNQGMDSIRAVVQRYAIERGVRLRIDEFDVRRYHEVPDLSYDVYISSGGPGSPLAESGTIGETRYFQLIADLVAHNEKARPADRKFAFFICYAFQLACKYFKVGALCRRSSAAFGVFPVHKTLQGASDGIFSTLPDPFYAMDSREWQVVMTGTERPEASRVKVLAIEKERPHVPYERAVMAVRFSPGMVGTQFHPEADAARMYEHLQDEREKQAVTGQYGERKYNDILQQLEDPGKIVLTQRSILPAFLDAARRLRVAQRYHAVVR